MRHLTFEERAISDEGTKIYNKDIVMVEKQKTMLDYARPTLDDTTPSMVKLAI